MTPIIGAMPFPVIVQSTSLITRSRPSTSIVTSLLISRSTKRSDEQRLDGESLQPSANKEAPSMSDKASLKSGTMGPFTTRPGEATSDETTLESPPR